MALTSEVSLWYEMISHQNLAVHFICYQKSVNFQKEIGMTYKAIQPNNFRSFSEYSLEKMLNMVHHTAFELVPRIKNDG